MMRSKHTPPASAIAKVPHFLSGSQAEALGPRYLPSGSALGSIPYGTPGEDRKMWVHFVAWGGRLVLEGGLMHESKECGGSPGHHPEERAEEPERRGRRETRSGLYYPNGLSWETAI